MSHWSMGRSWRGVSFWLENVKQTLFTGVVSKLQKKFVHGEDLHPEPILEGKEICAIFQRKSKKKDKKGQNIWKFEQKCKKFENILKKREPHVCDYRIHETARMCPDTSTLYAQRIKGIIIQLRKTVYINVYLHVNLTLLKVKTKNRYN